jgi:hypothetical protein
MTIVRKLREVVQRHTEGFILAVVIVGILAIAFLLRYRFSFLNFFFLPVILAGISLGRKKAVLLATLSVLLVVLYLVFQEKVFGGRSSPLSFDDLLNIVTWGGFLILTGGLLGGAAEQKENKLRDMKRAYTGVLSVLLKYLEVADESETRSVRVARLAGRMAESAGLDRRDVENVKSAALLCEASEIGPSRTLFGDVASFMDLEKKTDPALSDRERVLLKTAAALIKEIGPILEGYDRHYVREAETLDKDLRAVPIGSSLIALALICDRIRAKGSALLGKTELRSSRDLEGLRGRAFEERVVRAALATGF